jgi:hypothetical protein
MIFGQEARRKPSYLQELSSSPGEVFSAALWDSYSDTVLQRSVDWYSSKTAEGNHLTQSEAKALTNEAGVHLDIPEQGLTDTALSILIDRQYQKKVRQESISAGEHDFKTKALELGGGLLGGLLDPVNAGLSYVPFVGTSAYKAWMAAAQSPLGRIGVDATFGAAQGAVGASLLEVPQRYLADQLSDEYGNLHSLLNIAFGTALGGGLHIVSGGISELLGRKPGLPQTVSEAVDRMSDETRMNMARVAAAQALENRPIDVGPLVKNNELAARNRMAELREDAKLDPDLRRVIRDEINSLERQAGLEQTKDVLENKIQERLSQGETIDLQLDEKPTKIVSAKEDHYADSEGKAWPKDEVVSAFEEQNPQIEAEAMARVNDEPSTLNDIRDDINQANSEPDSKYIDESFVERQRQELEAAPKNLELEQAIQEAEKAVQDLKELALESGVEFEPLMKEALSDIKKAEDMEKGLKLMALCILRKGL